MAIMISALSGLLWGVLGAFLTQNVAGSHAWFAAPAGVLIGVTVYFLCRWPYRKSLWYLLPASVISTVATVALFGFFLGLADLTREIPSRNGPAVILQSIVGCLWGLVFAPTLWSLFALGFGNHVLLRHLYRRDAEQHPAGESLKAAPGE